MFGLLAARSRYNHSNTTPAVTSDQYWTNVISLMRFDGVDGSTSFVDARGIAWTAGGNAHISTTNSKFGGASAYFDGSFDYIRAASAPDFKFGSSDFTIEGFINPDSITAAGEYRGIITQRTTLSNFAFGIFQTQSNGGISATFSSTGNGNDVVLGPSGALTAGTWVHFAVTRQGSTWRMFIDGVLVSTTTSSLGIYTGLSFVNFGVLDDGSATSSLYFKGYIDGVRVTNGVARYTSNFTVPTEAYPDPNDPDWNSVLSLLHFDGANAGTTFTDDKGLTWTAGGTGAQLDTSVKKFGTASLSLGGSGYVTYGGQSSDFAFLHQLTEAFTFEFQINLNSAAGTQVIFETGGIASSMVGIGVYRTSANAIGFDVTKGSSGNYAARLLSADGAVTNGTFVHVEVDFDPAGPTGSKMRMFVNGIQVASTDPVSPSAATSPAVAPTFGRYVNGNSLYLSGHIDEFRITRGVAKHSATFTPPVGAYHGPSDQYWQSVISLLHFNGLNGSTSVTDQKGVTWSATGNAAISTSSPLIGPSSLALDGSGDYIQASSTANFALGTGDFTVEWFAKQTAAKAISHIDFRGGTSSSPRLMVYNDSVSPNTDLRLYVNGADVITAPTGTLIVGQRQHFAICRIGGVTRLFVDGVQVGSSWTDTTNYTAAAWNVGRNSVTTTRDFNGLIDEFRVTKGIGRYSSTFTPPTSAFPNY